MKKLEELLEWGGVKKDITLLVLGAISLICSIVFSKTGVKLPFDIAWIAIVLCGLPIVLEAIIGLVTRFDIKADVLVSLALIASIIIGEYFAAGEDSSIQRMIRLVQSADAGKAKIVGLADRWATWVVITALTAAVLTFIFTHEIIRSVTILVEFFLPFRLEKETVKYKLKSYI